MKLNSTVQYGGGGEEAPLGDKSIPGKDQTALGSFRFIMGEISISGPQRQSARPPYINARQMPGNGLDAISSVGTSPTL